MDKETITTALRLIVARSQNASNQAITAIRALTADSPIIQTRLNHVAQIALNDPACEWSPDERELIADLLTAEDNRRTKMLPIRLSEGEHAELSRLADEAGQTMAGLVREWIKQHG